MDKFTKFKLQTLFKPDSAHHDNILFKLHHQVNFFVLLAGLVFIFGENYLNGKSIVCRGGDAYSNQYCWLHGTGHVHKHLTMDPNGLSLCMMDQEEVTENKDRETHYYLWLPFILIICMGLVKIPRVIWKHCFERGIMTSLKERESGEKIAARFLKLRKHSKLYFIGFFFCELLNLVAVLLSFHILNSLLNEKFWKYGVDVHKYYNTKLTKNLIDANPDLKKPNPMCNLFPTEVACNLCTGSIGGGCNDRSSLLCILSNNLFNQYYFLILWCWWSFLLLISVLGIIYRLGQITIPSAAKYRFQLNLSLFGLEHKAKRLSLGSGDMFLLCRLARNLKGSVMEEVVSEIIRKEGGNRDTELETVITNEKYDVLEKENLTQNM